MLLPVKEMWCGLSPVVTVEKRIQLIGSMKKVSKAFSRLLNTLVCHKCVAIIFELGRS